MALGLLIYLLRAVFCLSVGSGCDIARNSGRDRDIDISRDIHRGRDMEYGSFIITRDKVYTFTESKQADMR